MFLDRFLDPSVNRRISGIWPIGSDSNYWPEAPYETTSRHCYN